MTIIAAASWGGQAYIGCDTAGTDSWGVQADMGAKLAKLPFGWIGFTGSYRQFQLLRPELRKVESIRDADQAMRFVEVVERCLCDAGWPRAGEGGLPICEDLSLLVATNEGAIYTVQSDFAILRHRHFGALGSGYQVALGALHSSKAADEEPAEAVRSAVRAACDLISTCAKPVHVREARAA